MEYYISSNGYIGSVDEDDIITGSIDPLVDTLISADDYRRVKAVQENSMIRAINGESPLTYLAEMISDIQASAITDEVKLILENVINETLTESSGE